MLTWKVHGAVSSGLGRSNLLGLSVGGDLRGLVGCYRCLCVRADLGGRLGQGRAGGLDGDGAHHADYLPVGKLSRVDRAEVVVSAGLGKGKLIVQHAGRFRAELSGRGRAGTVESGAANGDDAERIHHYLVALGRYEWNVALPRRWENDVMEFRRVELPIDRVSLVDREISGVELVDLPRANLAVFGLLHFGLSAGQRGPGLWTRLRRWSGGCYAHVPRRESREQNKRDDARG